MIRGGALLYSMFLVLVISIISSSFVLLNYYNSAYVVQILKQEQLYQDVHSGINYALSYYEELPKNTSTIVDLFEDEGHLVSLNKKSWGAFYLISATAKWRNKTASKTALVGTDFNTEDRIALYLSDQNKPLSLTGKTKITGICYLPKSGVKRAYIEGKSFVGNTLINGKKLNSNKNIPKINEELIGEILANYSLSNSINDSVIDYDVVFEQDSIVNTFKNKTLIVSSPFSIDLTNKTIIGNVIIKSDKNIYIRKGTIISEALFYAKGIVLDKNVKGDMQLFAKDSIIIGENCQLNYPSVLALIVEGKSSFTQKIEVGKSTSIKGAVFLYKEAYDRKHQAKISLAIGSNLYGYAYSSELLELKGEIIGGAVCKKLILKTPSSVYENHLMDATINSMLLSEHFVGVSLTTDSKQQSIIKWLN